MPRRNLFAASLVLALAVPCLAADKIVLQGGAVAEGKVLRESPEEVVVQQGDRELRIPRKKVVRIELDPASVVVDEALAGKLGCQVNADRIAAGEAILSTWPASRGTLDFALRHPEMPVRLEATHLLRRPQVTDFHDRVLQRIGDREAVVRMIALRVLRSREIRDAEPRVIKLLELDPDASVRMEATLALEQVGTEACLDVVLAAYTREPAGSTKRRLLGVLKKLTGEDLGEEASAWQPAVERAKTRAARAKGAKTPAGSRPAAPQDGAKDAPPAPPPVKLRPLAPTSPAPAGEGAKDGARAPADGRDPAAPVPPGETPPAESSSK
jgi:hypothetical protein